MEEGKLRVKIRQIINEILEDNNRETSDYSMFDVVGQLNLPDDLDYSPSLEDIKSVKDEWGDFQYEPMGGDEKLNLFKSLNQAKLRKQDDEDELKNIQHNLDRENSVTGGIKKKKMNKMGFNIN
jgi:hypothetical protein